MKTNTPMMDVQVIAKLADLSDRQYENGLLISALVQLMIEKRLITSNELQAMAGQLDAAFMPHPTLPIS